MVHVLYSLFDFFCFIILVVIAIQNRNVGEKQRNFKNYLLILSSFCLVDCFWGLIASHTIWDTPFFLQLASTLFYFFSAITSCSWLIYMIHYSGVINSIGNRKILYSFLIIPVVVLGVLLYINWNTGIIFSQFHGDYIRGQFKYVLITYALLYCYYFASVFIAIYISFIDNSDKNRRFKIAIICFTIIPVICGILQLRHPGYPYCSAQSELGLFCKS